MMVYLYGSYHYIPLNVYSLVVRLFVEQQQAQSEAGDVRVGVDPRLFYTLNRAVFLRRQWAKSYARRDGSLSSRVGGVVDRNRCSCDVHSFFYFS